MGGQKIRRSAAPSVVGKLADSEAYSLPATVVKVEVRFEPTVPMIVTAATAIRAAIRPYSIAVAPSWFLKSLVKVVNMPESSVGKLTGGTMQ
jgi:hypothetical protein